MMIPPLVRVGPPPRDARCVCLALTAQWGWMFVDTFPGKDYVLDNEGGGGIDRTLILCWMPRDGS